MAARFVIILLALISVGFCGSTVESHHGNRKRSCIVSNCLSNASKPPSGYVLAPESSFLDKCENGKPRYIWCPIDAMSQFCEWPGATPFHGLVYGYSGEPIIFKGSHAPTYGYGMPQPCSETIYSGTLTCHYQQETSDVRRHKRRSNILARAGPSGGNEGRYHIYQYLESNGVSNAFVFTTPRYPNGGNGASLDAERGQ